VASPPSSGGHWQVWRCPKCQHFSLCYQQVRNALLKEITTFSQTPGCSTMTLLLALPLVIHRVLPLLRYMSVNERTSGDIGRHGHNGPNLFCYWCLFLLRSQSPNIPDDGHLRSHGQKCAATISDRSIRKTEWGIAACSAAIVFERTVWNNDRVQPPTGSRRVTPSG